MLKVFDLFRRHLPQGAFGRNVLTLAGNAALGQGLVMLASPVLARIYSVSEFGNLQTYLSVLVFVVPIAAGRYDLAIVLPEDEAAAADLTVLSLSLALLSSLLAWLAISWLAWQPWIRATLTGLGGYLWLVPISVFGGACYAILSQWTLRQKNFSLVGRSKISQGIGQVTIQVILGGCFGGGVFGLLFGDAVGRIAGTWSFARNAWAHHEKLFRQTTWDRICSVARRYRQFPLISGLSALVNGAGSAVPPLLIASWYSSRVLGWYAMTDRVMCVPTVLIGVAVSQIYTVDAARLANTDPAALRALFSRTIRKLTWLGAPPFLLIALFGGPIFTFVFGPGWSESGQYARWLAMAQYVGFITWPVMPTLNILDRQSWQFGWDVGRVALTFGAIGLAHWLDWPARGAVAAYAVALLVGYIVHLALSLFAISRHGKMPEAGSGAAPPTVPALT